MSNPKGILFQGEMVRAILEGRKTQTRRVFPETKPCDHLAYTEASWRDEPTDWIIKENGRCYCRLCGNGVSAKNDFQGIKVPWQVGDILYVKETWWSHGLFHEMKSLTKSGKPKMKWLANSEKVQFAAEHHENWEPTQMPWALGAYWRKMSSLFLKKKDARIWLKVTNVRVERLLDISDDDAIAEGIDCHDAPTGGDDYVDYYRDYMQSPKGDDGWPWIEGYPNKSYFSLWDSINGAGSHKENPWVFVIEFERIEKP